MIKKTFLADWEGYFFWLTLKYVLVLGPEGTPRDEESLWGL